MPSMLFKSSSQLTVSIPQCHICPVFLVPCSSPSLQQLPADRIIRYDAVNEAIYASNSASG